MSNNNSIVGNGNSSFDAVSSGGIIALNNGNYVIKSSNWDNGEIEDVGAITLGNGSTSIVGFINSCNSVLGETAGKGSTLTPVFNDIYEELLVGKPAENIITVYNPIAISLGMDLDNQILNISGSTTVNFITPSCSLIASLNATGASPINGEVSATVRIEDIQPDNYVKRHYEIIPSINAATATGKITLYFTQAEFDDFNAIASVSLPKFPTDSVGIANLLIEKRAGANNDRTDSSEITIDSFSEIDPEDDDILWNEQEMRWEVSLDIVGFGSLFVKTKVSTIPDITTLELNTCDRPYNASFEPIDNAIAYQAEITIIARNNQVITRRVDEAVISGNFNIPSRLLGSSIDVRIAAIFLDEDTDQEVLGEFSDTKTFILGCDEDRNIGLENRNTTFFRSKIYPNPVKNELEVQHISFTNDQLKLQILDMNGKVLLEENCNLKSGLNKNIYSVNHLAAGTYILKVQTRQKVKQMKFVKL